MYEDDEIYDDTGDTSIEMSEPTGLSAIKARFEQAQNKFDSSPAPGPKPGFTPKPKPLPKYGGGGGLNISAAGDKKEESTVGDKKDEGIPNVLKPKSAIKQENDFVARDKTSDTSSGGPFKKRDSKVNIPEAFRQKLESSPVEIKPKPNVKPNKWAADSNNNAKVNGIATAKNVEIIQNALAHKKPNVGSVAKHSDSENTAAGNVSPRGKTADTSIPKSSDSSKPKTSPRGVGTGVLAQVAKLATGSNAQGDFRAKLKHVDQNKNSPSSVPLSFKKVEMRNDSTDSKDVPWRRNLKSAKFRERTKSIRTVIRMFDGKKFLKVDDSTLGDDSPPEKPEKLDCDVNLEALETDFKEAIENIDVADKEQHGWTEVEEVYDDCGNLQPVSSRAISLMGKRPTPKPRKRKKVPLIEPMTEDEELSEEQWKHAGFEGIPESVEGLPAPPPELLDEQETYDDVAVAEGVPPEEEEGLTQDELYEELPEEPDLESPPPTVGPKPSAKPPEVPPSPLPKSSSIEKSESENKPASEQTTDAKEQKRLEKERKKKEKEEKKLLENKEKELKKLLKVLGHKVTPQVLTTSVGKGKVKSNAKGKEKTGELAVTEGDEVDIIRMVDNPSGKWLVRVLSSQKDKETSHGPYSPLEMIGYCDEKNIEVDTSNILNFMKGTGGPISSSSAASLEQDQETYEAVDDGDEDAVEDEIYEECN